MKEPCSTTGKFWIHIHYYNVVIIEFLRLFPMCKPCENRIFGDCIEISAKNQDYLFLIIYIMINPCYTANYGI